MEDLTQSFFVRDESQQSTYNGVEQHQDDDGLCISDAENQDDLDDLYAMDEGTFSQNYEYDENTEPLPSAAAYDKEFAQIPVDIGQLLNGVQEAISQERRDHPRYKHMFNEAHRLQTFPASKKTRINIVGKSGSGKSSTLNCVLGSPNAAKALAAGKGCTHVPTAYEAPFPEQTSTCAAEVVFFSEAEIHKKMELMMDNYCAWHFEEHDWPNEEDQKYEDSAQTAFDAFRSLFCERDQFATARGGERFLGAARDDRNGVIAELVAWCEQLLPERQVQAEHEFKHQDKTSGVEEKQSEHNEDDNEADKIPSTVAQTPRTKLFEADTQEEIRELVESYAFSSSAYQQSSLWPLVKIVRMGLKNIRILEHVILVDWPGADDTNQLRANASAERIYDCDELWIVSSAARTCSEPTVTSMIARYNRTIPCSIICTQIDANRDDELAAEMRRQGHDTKHHDNLFAEEKRLQKQIASAGDRFEHWKAIQRNGYVRMIAGGKRQKLEPNRIMQEIAKYDVELRNCTERLSTVEQERLEAIIEVRQKYVELELRDKLEKYNKEGAALKLFFASNEHYMAHKGAKKVYGPLLSLKATGIPALRGHLLATAAPRTMSVVHEYIDHNILVLLEGISMVVDPGELQRCENTLNMVAEKKDNLKEWEDSYLNALRRDVDEQLVKPVEDRLQDFQDAALKVLESKSRWAYASIRAFAKKNGRHETKSIEWESWNEQFLEDVAEIILEHWDAFDGIQGRTFQWLQGKLIDECRDISSQMDNSSAQYRLDRDRFTRFIESQLRGIEHLCKGSKTEFKKKLGIARIEATQDNAENPSGYFSVAMQETWDQCKEYRGSGTKTKILTALETQLKLKGARSPFTVNVKSLAEAIMDNAKEQTRSVVEGVRQIMDNIRAWLDVILKEETNAPEDREVRERLKVYLEYALPRYNDIRAGFKMLEKRYEIDSEVEVKQE